MNIIHSNSVLPCLCFAFTFILGCTDAKFDSDRWTAQMRLPVHERELSSDAVQAVHNKFFHLRDRKEIIRYLGEPDAVESDGTFRYALGRDPSFGIDFWEMRLIFSINGRVQDVEFEQF